jgi:hypothetical protein
MLSRGIALTALTLALAGLPAASFAQAQSNDQTAPKRDGVSKPGVPGEPGNKSGPAVTPQNSQSGTSTEPNERTTREQDTSGVPGKPGNKSGPATRAPGSHDSNSAAPQH